MRLLLLDSGVFISCMVQLALISYDATYDRVETGEQAIEISKCRRYDALFLDLVLPDMDGYDVIREIRKTSYIIKIFALSSLTRPEAKAKAFRIGADAFLTYPFDETEFSRSVRNLLSRR